MICEQTVKKYCKDFTKIENYDKAMADTQIWHCHHRLETHNSDGERRLVDISKEELVALEMYYDRPPEELIFMVRIDHRRLHMGGKPMSEEWRRKISEAMKGKPKPKEWKKRMRGKKRSEETKRKMSEAKKGKKRGPYKRKTLENC